ncbi:MAG: hypothetical protein H8E44_14880 [Planctomycetes bacterium]|nr:hypothetical protein [Planctomycetota bacterium]MBL7043549.1 hypothetical protein [Pirellulaceae bacterium]
MMYGIDELVRFRKELRIVKDHSQPDIRFVDAAMWDVPDVIEDIEPDAYLPQGNRGDKAVAATNLIFRLTGKKHSEQAASWAIYRLIVSERLVAELATIRFPEPAEPSSSTTIVGVGSDDISITDSPWLCSVRPQTEPGLPVEAQLPNGAKRGSTSQEIQYLVVWATDELWFWWRDLKGTIIEDASHDVGHLRWPDGQFSITGRNWQLLRCLRGRRSTSYADVGETVWEDDSTKASTIRPQVHRLNDFLADKNLDLSWECEKEHVVLVTVH